MGLALHNTTDALDLLLLPGPSQVTPPPRRRAHYKGAFLRADRRLPLLDLVLAANHQRRVQRPHRTRRRPSPRSAQQWRSDEAAEGRALALAGTKLPGDGTPQLRRTPSLERQGAFRAPRTAKDRSRPGRDGDDAELYRLGLLYDDEHLRGSGFAMDAFACRGGEFTFRPAKRARRSAEQRYEDDLQLALDLSLAELGRDEAFARYLLSPDLDEAPSDSDSDQSPRLAPLHFVSGLLGEPEPLSIDIPMPTTESDSDQRTPTAPGWDWVTARSRSA